MVGVCVCDVGSMARLAVVEDQRVVAPCSSPRRISPFGVPRTGTIVISGSPSS